MELLSSLQPWHWFSAGILILILEALGAGGFLLGLGASALVMALILTIFPELTWYWQLISFAILSVLLTVIYWKKFRRFNHKTDQPMLNSRVERLIGRRVSLLTPILHGRGKVQIGDALWTVSCSQDLDEGQVVDVIGAEGMTLIVSLHNKQPTVNE